MSKVTNFNLPHLHLAPPMGVTPFKFCRDLWQVKTRVPGLLCAVVCVILRLATSVEHCLVTDRQTHEYGIYHASMALRGKTVKLFGILGTTAINTNNISK